MDTNLKEILIELQTQIHDLLQLQFNLNVAFNENQKKLNDDFYAVYEEIYCIKLLKKLETF